MDICINIKQTFFWDMWNKFYIDISGVGNIYHTCKLHTLTLFFSTYPP